MKYFVIVTYSNRLLIFRLWGDHGQKLLENSKICLLNATALGTEILKNLVLPGIGAFTIVDGEKVADEDIGSKYVVYALELYSTSIFVAFFLMKIV